MTKQQTTTTVKTKLNITDSSRDLLISDIYDNAVVYMNVDELPDQLEPMVRAKVERVQAYEAQFGAGQALDIASQTEGKCSWTYSITENSSRDAVYGFSGNDYAQMRRFRRVRK